MIHHICEFLNKAKFFFHYRQNLEQIKKIRQDEKSNTNIYNVN
jgi:hypothetical protein